ncbi:hypothetical protein [Bosea sp. 117]|uniref:hypothetical protein n=1 Tax=Bosea sp. 117 TaxID=1125973 RepID=UPI0004949E71|nr:hypothetical protein [Bosea sp. 117]
MTSYLVFPNLDAALERSRAAYRAVGPEAAPDAITIALWEAVTHPLDGRAALVLPATPTEAGIGLGQGAYDALLTAGEAAARLAELPADWLPPAS